MSNEVGPLNNIKSSLLKRKRINKGFPLDKNPNQFIQTPLCSGDILSLNDNRKTSSDNSSSSSGSINESPPTNETSSNNSHPTAVLPSKCHFKEFMSMRPWSQTFYESMMKYDENPALAKLPYCTRLLLAYEGLINVSFPEIYKKRKDFYTDVDIKEGASMAHRIPLKKRFLDFKWKDPLKDKRFSQGVHFFNKILDISSHLKMIKYLQCGFIVNGQLSFYPLTDPVVQDWIQWVDEGRLNPDCVAVSSLFGNTVYYDGCIITEYIDYREVMTDTQLSSYDNVEAILNAIHLIDADTTASNKPNVHRVAARPNEACFLMDMINLMNEIYGMGKWSDEMYLEVENKLRLALSSPLCLDPNPQVTRLLNFFNFQALKYRNFTPDSWIRANQCRNSQKKHHSNESDPLLTPTTHIIDKDNTMFYSNENFAHCNYRFNQIEQVNHIKKTKKVLDSELFSGLDARKTPSFKLSNFAWNISLQRIYRTIRLERDASDGSNDGWCYSLNVIVDANGLPELLLRIGKRMDTSQGGETLRFKLASPSMIESYIHTLKALVYVQDSKIKCVTDLTNPAAWDLFLFPS